MGTYKPYGTGLKERLNKEYKIQLGKRAVSALFTEQPYLFTGIAEKCLKVSKCLDFRHFLAIWYINSTVEYMSLETPKTLDL